MNDQDISVVERAIKAADQETRSVVRQGENWGGRWVKDNVNIGKYRLIVGASMLATIDSDTSTVRLEARGRERLEV